MSEEKKAEQDERVAFEAEWKRSGWGDADTKNQCFHFWQARAASTSANVAQGAEALGWAWERRYLNGGYSRKFCVSEFDARELAKDGENLPAHDLVYPFYAAPPAQTAITDDARDATKPEAPALLGGRDRLLAALERAVKAECALRALVDECDNDATPGWEDRMRTRIEDANHVLSPDAAPSNAAQGQAEDARDALRYRWLRDRTDTRDQKPFIAIMSAGGISMWNDTSADDAIDAALTAAQSGEKK